MNDKLSIIIPFVNEWPQVIWTIQGLAQELLDKVDFEIIAINNWCKEVENQKANNRDLGKIIRSIESTPFILKRDEPEYISQLKQKFGVMEDKGYAYLDNVSDGNKWLKVLHYDDKLSHWNAKKMGISHATGDTLFFCDAHCLISKNALLDMFITYKNNDINGTFHLPLTYQIMEWRTLIYGLKDDRDKGRVGYRFSQLKATHKFSPIPSHSLLTEKADSFVMEVPCMSSCGMMITKDIYYKTGGWPSNLGIYGGGENFMNFVLSVLGYSKYIFGRKPLFHHGERRSYSYNYLDMEKNRMIATYLFGGKEWLTKYVNPTRGDAGLLFEKSQDVLKENNEQRKFIGSHSKFTIDEWLDEWKLK